MKTYELCSLLVLKKVKQQRGQRTPCGPLPFVKHVFIASTNLLKLIRIDLWQFSVCDTETCFTADCSVHYWFSCFLSCCLLDEWVELSHAVRQSCNVTQVQVWRAMKVTLTYDHSGPIPNGGPKLLKCDRLRFQLNTDICKVFPK